MKGQRTKTLSDPVDFVRIYVIWSTPQRKHKTFNSELLYPAYGKNTSSNQVFHKKGRGKT